MKKERLTSRSATCRPRFIKEMQFLIHFDFSVACYALLNTPVHGATSVTAHLAAIRIRYVMRNILPPKRLSLYYTYI